jgi:hypothetical protein
MRIKSWTGFFATLSFPLVAAAQSGSPTRCAPLTNSPPATSTNLGKITYSPMSQLFGPIPVDNGPDLTPFYLSPGTYVVSSSLSYSDSRTDVWAPLTSSPRVDAQEGDAYWLWEGGAIALFCRVTSTANGQSVAGIQTVSSEFGGSIHFYPGEGCWETGPMLEDSPKVGGPFLEDTPPVPVDPGCDPSDDGSGSSGGTSGLYCDVIVQWNWVTSEWDIVGIDWDSCEWRDE